MDRMVPGKLVRGDNVGEDTEAGSTIDIGNMLASGGNDPLKKEEIKKRGQPP